MSANLMNSFTGSVSDRDFLMFFPHVYSPGAGADNPLCTKL